MIGTPRPGARAFHQRYSAEWEAERKLLIADADLWLLETGQIDAALADAVADWNQSTGDARTVDELRRHLDNSDYRDRQLMTRAGLRLYCWTLWAYRHG